MTPWPWASISVLYVSHDWDPARDGAEALAARRMAAALLDAGARVHVLASRRADQEFQGPRFDLTVVPSAPLPDNKFGRALQMLRSTVPEWGGNWVAGACDAGARILAAMPPDTLIYSRAMPGASNIAAWHLARRMDRSWVAHFSDPWPSVGPLSNGRLLFAPYKWPLFQLWRHRLFRDAGALTFTNPMQAEAMLRGRPQYMDKAFVVTHVPSFDAPVTPPPSDVFHIVHTGNLYYGRTAGALLQGLRMFLDRTPAASGRVLFTQAGWDDGDIPEWTARCGLESIVRCVGRVNQDQVGTLISTASLLVVIDLAIEDSALIPSKIPDYLGAGRPILAMTAPASALARLCREDGAGMTAHYGSPEEAANMIAALFAAWQERRIDGFLPRPEAIESFSRARVLQELGAAFAVARAAGAQVRPVNLRASGSTRAQAPAGTL